MARIPYAAENDLEKRDLVAAIAAQRGSVPHLYRMLLHSSPVAEGWLTYLTAIRQKTAIPGALREMAIIRIAQLNNAPYEAEQHIPIALREGVNDRKLGALADWRGSDAFDPMERAVLAYADAMTQRVQVPDDVFEAIRGSFDHTGIVELTATIAAYNMVSRFLEALAVHSHDALQR